MPSWDWFSRAGARVPAPLFVKRFLQSDRELVSRSGLFDAQHYLSQFIVDQESRRDPLGHFLRSGWRARRSPNPFFDVNWYLTTYPEVERSGVNPLVHYLRKGCHGAFDPGPTFDGAWYLNRYPDVAAARLNPLEHYLKFGREEGRAHKPPRGAVPLEPYDCWIAVNRLSLRDREELQGRLAEEGRNLPRISILTPVCNPQKDLLRETVASVLNQIYDDWELCVVDDASDDPAISELLEGLAAGNNRVRLARLDRRAGISEATNAAAAMARGELLLFLDHDDLLAPDCLAEVALYFATRADTDLIYTDDDKISEEGVRFAPQFKPDWSPTLLLSWMYMSHAFAVRRSLFDQLGGFRSSFDGSQDFDFALRASEFARHVGHIPKVLYHWRVTETSTALTAMAKPESIGRGQVAVNEALRRRGMAGATAFQPQWASAAGIGLFDVRFGDDGPSVTLVVAVDEQSKLEQFLEGISNTSYRNFDLLIVSGATASLDADVVLSWGMGGRQARVLSATLADSPAAVRNRAAASCVSDYVLFIDPAVRPHKDNWLSQLVGFAQLRDVGVAGAALHSQAGTRVHSGMVHNYNDGLSGDAFCGLPSEAPGYLGLATTTRETSSVRKECLLTSRSLFDELTGFDESQFPSGYYATDYCYRVIESGLTCVTCASASLQTAAACDETLNAEPAERASFRQRYHGWRDRWHNPNLSTRTPRFEIDAIRPATLNKDPVDLVAVTHNLNHEGAPTTLLELITGLKSAGFVRPVIVSLRDGPLQAAYRDAGIQVVVLGSENWKPGNAGLEAGSVLSSALAELSPQVILANTLRSHAAVSSGNALGIPTIWAQHESERWDAYFEFLPIELRQEAYDAFAAAYRVTYVADATRLAWQPLCSRRNFITVRHALEPSRLATNLGRWSKRSARARLGIADDVLVVTVVGTVCERKGQLDLAEAVTQLQNGVRERMIVFMAGAVAEPDYAARILEIDPSLRMTGQIEDPFLYYRATDIYVCTSRIESAPRTIMEAMECELPIITTPVFGIAEMVEVGTNCMFYQPGDTKTLANHLGRLLGDAEERSRLGRSGPLIARARPSFDEMIGNYAAIIRQAVNLDVPA